MRGHKGQERGTHLGSVQGGASCSHVGSLAGEAERRGRDVGQATRRQRERHLCPKRKTQIHTVKNWDIEQ